jgi:hypothetical protein
MSWRIEHPSYGGIHHIRVTLALCQNNTSLTKVYDRDGVPNLPLDDGYIDLVEARHTVDPALNQLRSKPCNRNTMRPLVINHVLSG